MRGNPWLRIVLVGIGIVLMGLPVYRLTVAMPVAAAPESTQPVSETKTFSVVVDLAHAPDSLAVSFVDQPILTGSGPTTEFTAPWTVALPKEGGDLLLHVKWPAGTPRTAAEVKVLDENNLVLADQTFWGTGSLTETVTVLPHQP